MILKPDFYKLGDTIYYLVYDPLDSKYVYLTRVHTELKDLSYSSTYKHAYSRIKELFDKERFIPLNIGCIPNSYMLEKTHPELFI